MKRRTFNFPLHGEVIQVDVVTAARQRWDASAESLDPSYSVRRIALFWVMAVRLAIPTALLRAGITGRPFVASPGRADDSNLN
jgi:hypothetical protein